MPITKRDESDDEVEPSSSFQSYAAEGDLLTKQGEFPKAIEAYTTALKMKPNDKNILVCRSRVYLLLGEPILALNDAELALKQDQNFFKAVYHKAEALYVKADFEMALVYYHRGFKQRPEFEEFRLGIQKASEAIDSAIGSTSVYTGKKYKFKPPQGIKLLPKPIERAKSAAPRLVHSNSLTWIAPKQAGQTTHLPVVQPKIKGEKKLLGHVYEDKEYLDKLLKDQDFSKNPNEKVKGLVNEALSYLDSRVEFWRQQNKPKVEPSERAKSAGSRPRKLVSEKNRECGKRIEEKNERLAQPKAAGGAQPPRPATAPPVVALEPTAMFTVEALKKEAETIQGIVQDENYELALRQTKRHIARVNGLKSAQEKPLMLVEAFYTLGTIYSKLHQYSEASTYLKRTIQLAKKNQRLELRLKALDDLGRTYVKSKRFREAITVFTERQSYTPKNTLHRACLDHDIGKCNYELGRYEKALLFSSACLQIAEKLNDSKWIMNAQLLKGQAEGSVADVAKLELFSDAKQSFTDALEISKDIKDGRATERLSDLVY